MTVISHTQKRYSEFSRLHDEIGGPDRLDLRHFAPKRLFRDAEHVKNERVAKFTLYLNEALRTCLARGQRPPATLLTFLGIEDIDYIETAATVASLQTALGALSEAEYRLLSGRRDVVTPFNADASERAAAASRAPSLGSRALKLLMLLFALVLLGGLSKTDRISITARLSDPTSGPGRPLFAAHTRAVPAAPDAPSLTQLQRQQPQAPAKKRDRRARRAVEEKRRRHSKDRHPKGLRKLGLRIRKASAAKTKAVRVRLARAWRGLVKRVKLVIDLFFFGLLFLAPAA